MARVEDERAAVVVQSVTIAASLVGIHVDTSGLGSGFGDEVDAGVEFTKLVVTATRVEDDLNTSKTVHRVWRHGRPELLASLTGERAVQCLESDLANAAALLFAWQFLDDGGESIVFHPSSRPGCEVPHLSEVAIIAHVQLRPDGKHLTVEGDKPGVVTTSTVSDGETQIDDDILALGTGNDVGSDIPRVVVDIIL
jgi:hypothetical protein